jgi:hypothetical protein
LLKDMHALRPVALRPQFASKDTRPWGDKRPLKKRRVDRFSTRRMMDRTEKLHMTGWVKVEGLMGLAADGLAVAALAVPAAVLKEQEEAVR